MVPFDEVSDVGVHMTEDGADNGVVTILGSLGGGPVLKSPSLSRDNDLGLLADSDVRLFCLLLCPATRWFWL